jgi:hypothetical protein
LNNNTVVVKKKRRLPAWLKAILIKAWFAGAVFFFVGWGLFISTTDQLDLTLILGIVYGAVTDLMVNRIFFQMGREKGEYLPFVMISKNKYLGFLFNILYGIVLCSLVVYTYGFINIAAISIFKLPETKIVLGAEPILFGLLCMGYDMLFLQIKKLIKKKRTSEK